MKKHIAVFALYLRASLKWALLLDLGLVAFNILSFGLRLRAYPESYLVDGCLSGVPRILAVVFLLLTAVLCRLGIRSREGLTLERLSVCREAIFFWQAAANTLLYFLLLAVQALTVVVLSRYFFRLRPEDGNQALFAAFYHVDLLHSLLPLEDWPRHLTNAVVLVCLGLTTASVPALRRQRKLPWEALILTAAAILLFVDDLEQNAVLPFLAILLAVTAPWRALSKEESLYEEA